MPWPATGTIALRITLKLYNEAQELNLLADEEARGQRLDQFLRQKLPQYSRSRLQSWVKQHLRSSRVPQTLEFWEELPYNETGKLLRRRVKAALCGDGP